MELCTVPFMKAETVPSAVVSWAQNFVYTCTVCTGQMNKTKF